MAKTRYIYYIDVEDLQAKARQYVDEVAENFNKRAQLDLDEEVLFVPKREGDSTSVEKIVS